MSAISILDDLRRRGLIEQFTNEEAIARDLSSKSVSIYCGVDPTADSIHVGHLLPFLTLGRLQRQGHRPVILVGGATGMIGDPSGRSSERSLLTLEQVAHNVECIRRQVSRFVSFEGENAAVMVNNIDWIGPLTYLEWLRDVGKYFTVNYMLGKESVRSRLEDREQGISYTEFSYMLLQAYDYLELNRTQNCTIQVGGSDQWGNITAGIELIRKKGQGEAYGMTFPLVTTSTGEKFGKSAGNAIWLDPERTSPYALYQYFLRSEDADVERFLKFFSLRPVDEIEAIVAAHAEAPHKREAQRILAEELTELIHGEEGLRRAKQATDILFGSEIEGLSDKELTSIFADVPAADLDRSKLEAGYPIVDLLADSGLEKSKGDARRSLKGGGVYVNNRRVDGEELVVTPEHLASETILVLRKGKKSYLLARFAR